ncbi:MAG: serine/threonine protein kinase [Gemmatimonadota bacterium]|nr:serine/threonine protein kinase [Gemmatimonadota bacterium]
MRELTPATGQAAQNASIDAMDAAALRARVQKAVGESYQLEAEIGRGGMAVVYAARDLKLRRTVALKVLPPDLAFRAEVRTRFVREAQTAAGLNHPNIVPIYAVDERDGMVFFAMSLIVGETLATRLIREPRPPVQFVENILIQVADALAYAHTAGVVHRDIKPDNILIDSETSRATVTDFGIARALEGGARLTLTGVAVGTPAFMSPEQATGDREIDGRSDVYSLGIVGYLMLAGRLPFEATSTPAMLVKHVSEAPPALRQYRPDAPPRLVAVIEKCLAKKPENRWSTAGAMRDALRDTMRDATPVQGNDDAATRTPPTAQADHTRAQQLDNTRAAESARWPLSQQALPPEPPNAQAVPRTEEEWRAQYATGKRAEDWSPTNLPMPLGGTRRDFREWRREINAQKAESKMMWRAQQSAVAHVRAMTKSGANRVVLAPGVQIHRFRGEVMRNAVLLTGLAAINVATSRHFPWVIFPAFGISMGLIAKYSKLREQGISLAEIVSGEPGSDASALPNGVDPTSMPVQQSRAVSAWRRHAGWAAAWAGVSFASFAIGSTFNAEPLVVPFVAAGLAAAWNTARALFPDRWRLKRVGLTMSDALTGNWQSKIVPVSDARPRDVRLRERAEQLVGAGVLASPLGKTVRAAVEDLETIKETSSKLSDADRILVPDVDPTAEALLERIAAIAGSLERLDRDMPDDAMHELRERIQAVEREAASAPDRERRLALLTRQQTSLNDLAQRRETLQRQMESASMALRSLRLDMVKLSALGMGALGDVTNATQEARALSKDIGRAIDAADEVRRL